MNYFEDLPHMKAKTSIRISNDITATVDNTIERVFDFIVAEDVVIKFLKGKPALLKYDMEIGPWNHSGATRVNTFEGDSKLRESIVDWVRPTYFQYMLTEFKGGELEGMIKQGIATFSLASYGPRTLVNWSFQMTPASPDKTEDVQKFMTDTWYPWMESFITAMKKALDKDIWSA